MLELRNISKTVGGATHIHPTSLVLPRGSLNVLLGPTLSGKTSLMRLMAGLDKPSEGSILFDGQDVTGMPVQKRNVAMVYQQFINYPALTVYENIASPMRIAGKAQSEIDSEVRKAADLLKLTPYLDRTPLNLSGGQQQRTAIARAIVKRPISSSSMNRWPISTTSCVRNSVKSCRASLPNPVRSLFTQQPNLRKPCCSAAIRRHFQKAASRSSGAQSMSIAARSTSSRHEHLPTRP